MSGEKVEKKKISPSLIISVIVIIVLLAALVYYATLPPKVEVVPTTIVQTALKTETLPGTTIVRTEVKTTTITPTPTKPPVVELRFWHTYSPPEEKRVKELLAEFEKLNPDIKVTMEMYPYSEMHRKLITSLAGGVAPDLARIDIVWIGEFAEMGALLELDDYVTRDGIKKDDFFPGPWDTCVYKGKLYGLPLNTNTRILFYRKDIFAAKGLVPPKTWDEFLSVAKKLTEDKNGDGVIDRWGFADGSWMLWHQSPWIWQAGGDFFNPEMTKSVINETGGIKAMQFFADMIFKYKVFPSDPSLWGDPWKSLALDTLGMCIEGPWARPLIESVDPIVAKEKLGWALLPKDIEEASVVGGEDVVIFKQTKHPEAAWKFLKFLISKDFQLEMGKIGVIPTLKTAALDPVLTADSYYATFMEQMKTARSRPVHPRFEEMNRLSHDAAEAIMLGKKSVKEALDWLAAELNKLLGS
jgi:multiple sugar transport system substrate-binding protein